MPTLETKRLLLRDFRPDDFEEFYAATEGPEHRRFYSEEEMVREVWQSIFERIIASIDVEGRLMYQLAIYLKTGEIIGTCDVRIEDKENHQASFGFSELPIHRIYAETNIENLKARALAEDLGMHLEGELGESRFFLERW